MRVWLQHVPNLRSPNHAPFICAVKPQVHSHSSILAALLRQYSPPEVNNADEDDSVSFSKEHDDDREEGSGLLLYCLYPRRALPSSRAIIGVHIPPLEPQTVTVPSYRQRSPAAPK
ncbi:hypothetical protein E4U31_006830 [Claviceps sp. LM219 group G6]|nr:hypothetical protein E4U31_006830 [Claviceps sp. LM219 group G6]